MQASRHTPAIPICRLPSIPGCLAATTYCIRSCLAAVAALPCCPYAHPRCLAALPCCLTAVPLLSGRHPFLPVSLSFLACLDSREHTAVIEVLIRKADWRVALHTRAHHMHAWSPCISREVHVGPGAWSSCRNRCWPNSRAHLARLELVTQQIADLAQDVDDHEPEAWNKPSFQTPTHGQAM